MIKTSKKTKTALKICALEKLHKLIFCDTLYNFSKSKKTVFVLMHGRYAIHYAHTNFRNSALFFGVYY